jgi:hypothetical protein
MKMLDSVIDEERFQTAKEFLDTLRITNPRWMSKDNGWEPSWIFRGQSDANWQLIPSAWRAANLERFKQKFRLKFEAIHLPPLNREMEAVARLTAKGDITTDEANERISLRPIQVHRRLELSLQYFAEMQAVKEFTEFADRLGHPVPGASEFIVHYQSNFKGLPDEDFLISKFAQWGIHDDPFNVNCSTVALAQHHGIPTRLLDWTESPLVAAFFAAEQIISNEARVADFDLVDRSIAIWAISKEVFSGNERHILHPSPLQQISRPRHDISYLLAQKAVFTHDKSANEYFRETGRWRSIEEVIGNNSLYLKKLTLPAREVGELLRLLWLEDISRAHLMPTYDNVTRALQTKARWESPFGQ